MKAPHVPSTIPQTSAHMDLPAETGTSDGMLDQANFTGSGEALAASQITKPRYTSHIMIRGMLAGRRSHRLFMSWPYLPALTGSSGCGETLDGSSGPVLGKERAFGCPVCQSRDGMMIIKVP